MCGVAGIIKLKGALKEFELDNLKAGLQAQAHRGPDATGVWHDETVALGHNRLSIIDLSVTANQPFSREDLNLKIIFNGEIYNYQILKTKLLAIGYTFQTSSDTEVVLVAFKEYGKDLCKHLLGMFVFVIYDTAEKSLFIARDRFGEKPLFYIHQANTLYFASELQALRKLYNNTLTINQSAVVDLLENMYINNCHAIYNEVQVLMPASFMQIKGGNIKIESYYDFPKKVTRENSFDELKSEVKELLYEIIAQELHADVPVATFLSSGIDSSLITAISKELKPDILAVTMATSESHSDEAPAASEFAKKLDIKQEIVPVNPGSLDVLGHLLKNIQPLADASLIPSYLVTRAVSGQTKVMLSGDGGDEVFGSYNKPNLYLKEAGSSNAIFSGLINQTLGFKSDSTDKYLSDKNRIKYGSWESYYAKNNLSYGIRKMVFRSGEKFDYTSKVYQKIKDEYASNPEKASFGVDILTRLPGDFLHKVDSAAMYASIEVRAPFLDHRLVNLSLESSMQALSPNGIDKEITKSLLMDFTGELSNGSKKGFSIPYMKFLQGPWGDILEAYLLEDISSNYFNFNIVGIKQLLYSFRKGPTQRIARVLFTILVLEIWLRVFHLEVEVDLLSKTNTN